MSKLFVGVDPGEAHVGFAILNIKRTQHSRLWTLNMGVFDVEHHGFYHVVEQLCDLPQVSNMSVDIIIESYQQRPVGHQAFNTPLTPQFIGAIRMLGHIQESESYLIPPGPIDDLDRLFFTQILQQWEPKEQTHKHWKHALSALRVIGIHLISTEPERIMDLKMAYDVEEVSAEWEAECENDVKTQVVQWRTPK